MDAIISVVSKFVSEYERPNIHGVRSLITSSIAQGMMEVHPYLWDQIHMDCIARIYEYGVPTSATVWRMVKSPPNMNAQQDTILDYLRRYIFSLDREELSKFLRFVTGSSTIVTSRITLSFCSSDGLQRIARAYTCTGGLVVSTKYNTYFEFKQEFNSILQNSDIWFMDNN